MKNHPGYAEILNRYTNQTERDDVPPLGDPPLPLLITGITGVAGYNALAYFQSRFPGRVFGVLPPDVAGFAAPDVFYLPVEDFRALEKLFERYRFASVLDCAGNCALKACQLEPKIAWTLNVEVVRNLARLTRRFAIRLVHLSVDMVYGGRPGGNWREEEPPSPVNVYGETMVQGEERLRDEDPYAATLRISMPMGLSFNGHAGAIDWIAARFKKNRPATLYYDEVRTPTYCDCLSRVCRAFLANAYAGLLHAGGRRQVSLYQMAQIINRVGGYRSDLLYGLMKGEACPVPPRVSNCALNSEKIARVLGYEPFDPWPFDPALVPTDRAWHRRPFDGGSTGLMNRVLGFNPRYAAGRPAAAAR
ncbi:MAG: sugar nucleotide-binding protein [Thermoguttaceae bacterium]|nr:sugar nucleotide-binding protein [Thermoguttaceae bacterium]